MSCRSAAVGLLATAALLTAAAPAVAQDTVTPAGPATVRGNWLGPWTAEGRPPEVLVGWTVKVGPGSNAGPVRLRVLRPGTQATVVGSGPTEQLPAAPGTYAFALPTGIRYDPRDSGLAIDQEVGGHAIVTSQPEFPDGGLPDNSTIDIFRPRLAEDAAGVAFSERRTRLDLLVRGTIERDVDEDLLGDVTQDVGDLRLLGARILARERVTDFAGRETERVLVAAQVLNAGFTVRHSPHIVVSPEIGRGFGCAGSGAPGFVSCSGAPIPPGAESEVRMWIFGLQSTRIEVAAEGPDLTPEDNAGPIATDADSGSPAPPARLRLRAVPARDLRVRVTASRAGTAQLAARVAGLRIGRTLRFATPGTRTARLMPAARRDRRRLSAARRRPGRLRATVTATMGSARASTRTLLR